MNAVDKVTGDSFLVWKTLSVTRINLRSGDGPLHAHVGAVALDDHLADAGLERDLHAMTSRGPRHRLGDRAHAADGVAPGALLAVHLAEHVVQQHIGRAWRVRAGIVADHGVEAEGGLDRLALEPAVQKGPRALGEQVEGIALPLQRHRGQTPPLRRRRQQRPQAAAGVWRRLQRQVAQHLGHPLQRVVIGRQHFGIVGGEAAKLGLRALQPAAQLQIAAVGLGQEV